MKNPQNPPKLKGMIALSRRIGLSVAMVMLISVGHAQQSSGYPPTDLYTSPPNESLGIGIPSGNMALTPSSYDTEAKPFTTTAAETGDTTNYLGCGGVGQGDYTTALFNMPEVFTKFQTDVNSTLAKQILTMNYSMPQTAALFDTLNSYGNQRYLQFQQGCSLDALKQDAKRQYITACMTDDLINKRKQYVQAAAQSTSSASGSGGDSTAAVTAMAYAQALEICNMQYAMDSDATSARTKTTQSFAEEVRKAENINDTIKSLLCKRVEDSPAGDTADNSGCWEPLLLPQVRLCHDNSLEGGCGDGKEYGVREAVLPMVRLFDTMRFVMDDTVVNRSVLPFIQQVKGIDPALQRTVANGTLAVLSGGMTARNMGSDATMVGDLADGTAPGASVRNFQFGFMNCKDSDMFRPLYTYMTYLNMEKAVTTEITLTQPKDDDYKKAVTRVKVDGITDDDITVLTELVKSSLGCAATQTIPIFDPNITASLTIQCNPTDRLAFYSMAGNDVALVATRNVYRYLALRLKQVYGQLISQDVVPVSSTTTSGSSDTAAIASPELNRRLANAVKEIMIPAVESQVERLNEIDQSRGQFAARVQQIYTTKQGCMSTGAGR